MKIKITLSVLVSLTLLSVAQAVSPPPDGGYSGYNTAEGQNALFSLNTGLWNTGLGAFALYGDTSGNGNTAVGINVLRNNLTGGFNTGVGLNALFTNNGDPTVGQGSNNCATGAYALFANTTGSSNTADGAFALSANNTGFGNTAIGASALERNTIGGGNTAIGEAALNENVTGSFNTAIGTGALLVAGGNSNTVVGSGAGGNVGGANHVICIGQGVGGANVDNSCYIDSIWNQPGGSQPVYVNSDGKLGLLVSSRRFKDEIKPIGKASTVIYALEPVSFHYKPEIEPTRPRGFGLIAEDVEKVSPDLVTRGTDGKVNSVRYDEVNAMLLNEFLKAHRKMEEQQKQIDALTTQLKEQAKQLHNVSVQVGLKTPARRVVLNDP
jgi:trimeric autotransporter adhesin